MGSIQQSILGVFCIATAFLLGQYIRTHPSPESLEQQRQQQAAIAPAPSFAFSAKRSADPSTVAKTSPRLPSPAAGFASGASERTARRASGSPDLNTLTSVESLVLEKPPVPAERKIDIPDFSQLAASFKNTPLALQGINGSAPSSPLPDSASAGANSNTGSFYVRPAPERQPIAASSGQAPFEQGQAAFAGSRPEPVAPPQPTERYQLRERPTSFRKEDFQPRLIAKESARRKIESSPDSVPAQGLYPQNLTAPQPKRISLAPPDQDDSFMAPEIPDIEVTMPKESQAKFSNPVSSPHVRTDRANNRLHSYYDVDAAASSSSVLDRQDFQRLASKTPVTNRRIPFGLNAQGKQELTRIQSRQQTSIDLQTDRFSQHTTRTGDTLQSLSTEYYGKPDFYLDIYLANQQLLKNPSMIPAGIQLRIPRYGQ